MTWGGGISLSWETLDGPADGAVGCREREGPTRGRTVVDGGSREIPSDRESALPLLEDTVLVCLGSSRESALLARFWLPEGGIVDFGRATE